MAKASFGSLSFSEQIEFFRRKVNLPTHGWTDIWQSAHDHAFVVAGANRAEIVVDFRDAIDKAIAGGTTLEEFRKDFDTIVKKHGWSYNGSRGWRSRIIYETNLRTSYAAGIYAQLKASTKAFPYWQYRHSGLDKVPREFHITPPPDGLNGLVLAHDDPFWNTYFPPNGWGCTCYISGISTGRLKQLGKDGPDQAPSTETEEVTVGAESATPRIVQVARGTDPGFSYAPGRDAWLREHASRAVTISDAQSSATWEPVLQTTAQDLGRPPLPLVKPPVDLGRRLADADAVTQALTELMGSDVRMFDVYGLPVTVEAASLGRHIDPARSEYLPLLIDTLTRPSEVWISLERETVSGEYRIRTRIIKQYQLSNNRVLLVVADEQDGSMVTWTIGPNGDLAYANRKRRGILWWSELQ